MREAEELESYLRYKIALEEVDALVDLTEIAYGLSGHLLFAHPSDTLPDSLFELTPDAIKTSSFSEADITVSAAWLPFRLYAQMVGLSESAVASAAANGELGEVHEQNGVPVVLWPEEARHLPPDDQPSPFRATASIQLTVNRPNLDDKDTSQFEATQAEYLRLAHAIGDPDGVMDRSSSMLYRVGLLLQWTAFEVFVRQTTKLLLRTHPEKLRLRAKGRDTVSFDEIFSYSEDLSSLEALIEGLVERTVTLARGPDRSVLRLIDFLVDAFPTERSPFESWYVQWGAAHRELCGLGRPAYTAQRAHARRRPDASRPAKRHSERIPASPPDREDACVRHGGGACGRWV